MNAPTMASIVADAAAAKAAATIARLHAENTDLRDKLDSLGLSEAELERRCKDLDLQIAELTTENERLHGCQTAYQNTIDGLEFLNTKLMEERDRVVERLSPRMASIVADVAAAHGVPLAEMMSRSRCRQDVEARQEAMWRCREVRINSGRHRYSLQQIGQFFKRNHATVIFACQRHLERTSK